MLVGHYAIALAAKALDRKPALGSFFLATQLVDLVWIVMLVLRLEEVSLELKPQAGLGSDILKFGNQPFSHSLAASLVWGLLFAVWCYRGRLADGNLYRSLLLGFVVSSHWWLDLLVHDRDLPILFGDKPLVGAFLWQSAQVAFWLELILLLACFALYCLRTRTRPETLVSLVWLERKAAWWPAVMLFSLVLVHFASSYMGLLIELLSAHLGQWVKTHALVLIQLMLGLTWIGLPILAFLTLDRVRGARI